MMLTIVKVIPLLMLFIIYMQLNYLKLCLKMRLLFHYVYLAKLVFGGIPNTLNGKKNRGSDAHVLMEKN